MTIVDRDTSDWIDIYWQWNKDLDCLEIMAVGEIGDKAVHSSKQITKKELGFE